MSETCDQPKEYEITNGFYNIKSWNARLREKFPLKQGLQVFVIKDYNADFSEIK